MNPTPDQQPALQALAAKLDLLIGLCRRLAAENASLKRQVAQLADEKAVVLEKTHMAKARAEALIARLKQLEQSS